MTGKARSAIRRATREAVRKQYCDLGRQILRNAFENVGVDSTKDALETACIVWRKPQRPMFWRPSGAAN